MTEQDDGASEAGGGEAGGGEAPPRDASFADSYKPIRLAARDAEDLKVLSALLQDAVVRVADMAYLPDQKRFAMVLNRYRWEEKNAPERVRAGAHFDGVLAARIRGFDLQDKDKALSLLELRFEPSGDEEALSGRLSVVFAGEAEVALEIEAIEGAMSDMGRPWRAVGKPLHQG